MAQANALPASRLYRSCPPGNLGFETTAELEPQSDPFGQRDAMDALAFGLAMAEPGYNIFVLGLPGSGRTTLVRRAVEMHAARARTPPDWCYVYNFSNPQHPRSLKLPAGRAPAFARDIRDLVTELRTAIPEALTSDSVTRRRTGLLEETQRQAAETLDDLRREFAADEHVALVGSPDSVVVAPARGGEPLDRAAYRALPAELREKIDEHVREATAHVANVQLRIQKLMADAKGRIEALTREVARRMVELRIAGLKEKYNDSAAVVDYLDGLCDDVVEHAEKFAIQPETGPAQAKAAEVWLRDAREEFTRRYEVNVAVPRDPDTGAPVVEEPDPHVRNLLGRLGLRVQFGVVVADFGRITPGALQRANGGFLILDAAEVLSRPPAWAALKRALRTRELRPAESTAELGAAVADSLEPEPIPSDVKVILIGEPPIYNVLRAVDVDFRELFKVKVDFQPQLDRTPEAEHGYARLIAAQVRAESLPAFEVAAVAALIEEGSRLANDQAKLTTRLGEVTDLVRESAFWCRASGRERVGAADVGRALVERDRRNRRMERELLELIDRGILAFEPAGEKVGQLHGIGLMDTTGEIFGRPIRVMASAYMGTGGVIDIEREAKLSGPIHSKGFLVLSGYLGWMFARTEPLILSASVSFEQLYEEVEGDSASVAELYALLSAIGEVPLRQGIAVTGAISEKGLVLPVGGVTQKVEGFFAACQRRGLTGNEGVILPRRNAHNLVIRPEAREAVESGRFHVWTIDRVEDGWTILAGRNAGERLSDGTFPEGTVHRAVHDQLSQWARAWKAFAQPTARA